MKQKIIIMSLLALFATPLLSACNTTRGLGQDIEALGDNIEDEAEEKKTY